MLGRTPPTPGLLADLVESCRARVTQRTSPFAVEWPLSIAAVAVQLPTADAAGPPVLGSRARERVARRLVAAGRVLSPATVALVGLVAMTGLAAAQSGSGGVCGTPAVNLFEWSARTGAGLLLLGGLVYGAYKHARAAMTPNPERASRFRRTGTTSMLAGPIFGLVIVFGKQAAGAAGFSVAECANLLPWF